MGSIIVASIDNLVEYIFILNILFSIFLIFFITFVCIFVKYTKQK